MKKLILVLLILFTAAVFPQDRQDNSERTKKFEQYEKLKLIEILAFDEETAIRFFARRNEHLTSQKEILKEKSLLLSEIEKEIKKGTKENKYDYAAANNKLIAFDKQILDERINFIRSLQDILTHEQIAKLLLFEAHIKHHIRNAERNRRK